MYSYVFSCVLMSSYVFSSPLMHSYAFLCILMSSYVFSCLLMCFYFSMPDLFQTWIPSRTHHFHLQDVGGSMQDAQHSRGVGGTNPAATDRLRKIENHPNSTPAQVVRIH